MIGTTRLRLAISSDRHRAGLEAATNGLVAMGRLP